jgi:hypothetical protein
MSFRRIPKEIDPRRPPKRRERGEPGGEIPEPHSYGQYLDVSPDDVEELERATGEVAREGASVEADEAPAARQRHHKEIEEREDFEDMTGEVSREGSSRRD